MWKEMYDALHIEIDFGNMLQVCICIIQRVHNREALCNEDLTKRKIKKDHYEKCQIISNDNNR